MLVTACAVYLLTLNLVLLFQVWLMSEENLLGEFDLFGFELIIRFAVAIGGHTAGVDDSRSRPDRLAAELDVGETFRRLFGNMYILFQSP